MSKHEKNNAIIRTIDPEHRQIICSALALAGLSNEEADDVLLRYARIENGAREDGLQYPITIPSKRRKRRGRRILKSRITNNVL